VSHIIEVARYPNEAINFLWRLISAQVDTHLLDSPSSCSLNRVVVVLGTPKLLYKVNIFDFPELVRAVELPFNRSLSTDSLSKMSTGEIPIHDLLKLPGRKLLISWLNWNLAFPERDYPDLVYSVIRTSNGEKKMLLFVVVVLIQLDVVCEDEMKRMRPVSSQVAQIVFSEFCVVFVIDSLFLRFVISLCDPKTKMSSN